MRDRQIEAEFKTRCGELDHSWIGLVRRTVKVVADCDIGGAESEGKRGNEQIGWSKVCLESEFKMVGVRDRICELIVLLEV